MSYKAEVLTGRSGGTWVGNGCRFATHPEACAYITDLMYRWTSVTDTRVVKCDDEVNSEWKEGRTFPVITGGPI
jgi:hypothetical protein